MTWRLYCGGIRGFDWVSLGGMEYRGPCDAKKIMMMI